MRLLWLVALGSLFQAVLGEDDSEDPVVEEPTTTTSPPTTTTAPPTTRPSPVSNSADDYEHERRQLEKKQKSEEKRANQKAMIVGHIRQLEAAGSIGTQGAWLYGDWKEEFFDTVVECAQKCESLSECYHWNYAVHGRKCDLKRNHGGVNHDQDNWVTGNSSRYHPGRAAAKSADGDL